MDEIWAGIVENLGDRVSGPMRLRLLLQPAMACIYKSDSNSSIFR
jgi:hypothetical protein